MSQTEQSKGLKSGECNAHSSALTKSGTSFWKKILSCFGSIWWRNVLHEHKVNRWINTAVSRSAWINHNEFVRSLLTSLNLQSSKKNIILRLHYWN